jgi:hypothetical protein
MWLGHEIIKLKKHGRREEKRKEQAREPDRAFPDPPQPLCFANELAEEYVIHERWDEYRQSDRHNKEYANLNDHSSIEQIAS